MKLNNEFNKKILLLIAILIVFIFAYFFLHNDKQLNSNLIVGENVNRSKIFNLSDNVNFVIPENWKLGQRGSSDINIVKFGSPTTFAYLEANNKTDEFFVPTITIEQFTIDPSLSAREVANLIQDQKIADKIEQGTKECYFSMQNFKITNYGYYAFRHDNTDLSLCQSEGTETGINSTVIIKNTNEKNTLMIDYSMSNKEEYDNYYNDFIKLISSITFNGISVEVNKQ